MIVSYTWLYLLKIWIYKVFEPKFYNSENMAFHNA